MFKRKLHKKERELAWTVLYNCLENGCTVRAESIRILCKDTGQYMIELLEEGYPIFHSFMRMYRMIPDFLTKAYDQEILPYQQKTQSDEEIEDLVNAAFERKLKAEARYYKDLN